MSCRNSGHKKAIIEDDVGFMSGGRAASREELRRLEIEVHNLRKDQELSLDHLGGLIRKIATTVAVNIESMQARIYQEIRAKALSDIKDEVYTQLKVEAAAEIKAHVMEELGLDALRKGHAKCGSAAETALEENSASMSSDQDEEPGQDLMPAERLDLYAQNPQQWVVVPGAHFSRQPSAHCLTTACKPMTSEHDGKKELLKDLSEPLLHKGFSSHVGQLHASAGPPWMRQAAGAQVAPQIGTSPGRSASMRLPSASMRTTPTPRTEAFQPSVSPWRQSGPPRAFVGGSTNLWHRGMPQGLKTGPLLQAWADPTPAVPRRSLPTHGNIRL